MTDAPPNLRLKPAACAAASGERPRGGSLSCVQRLQAGAKADAQVRISDDFEEEVPGLITEA